MGAYTSIVVVVMMFAIGNTRASVAQAVHVVGCHRRAKDCRRKEQGEHLQHGAQSVHGRLDIEYDKRAQAVVSPPHAFTHWQAHQALSFADRRLSGEGWRYLVSLKSRSNGRMQYPTIAIVYHLKFVDPSVRYAKISRPVVG